MLDKFFIVLLLLFTLIGAVVFLLTPGNFWVIGPGLIFLSWLLYLIFIIPQKPSRTRGWWALTACFILFAVIATAAILIYLQTNSLEVRATTDTLNSLPYLGARLFSLFVGTMASVIITPLFFAAIGYFSSIYILALPEHEGISFWNAFRSFVSLIFNIQQDWLLVEDGQIKKVKEKGPSKTWFSLGKIMVTPGHAIMLEKKTEFSRICGPGTVITNGREKIREVFELKGQFHSEEVKNVMTRDQIPLTVHVDISYGIPRAADPEAKEGILADNWKIFAVEEARLRRGAASRERGWKKIPVGAVVNNLRDQFMMYTFDELFDVENASDQISPDDRRIKRIETAILESPEVKKLAEKTIIEVGDVDIREILLPDEMKEAITTRMKSEIDIKTREQLMQKVLNHLAKAKAEEQLGNIEVELANIFAQSPRSSTENYLWRALALLSDRNAGQANGDTTTPLPSA